jgi:glycosyltransferase involved in cell wall biosynthesis
LPAGFPLFAFPFMTNNNPKISVIMSVYNAESYLRESIESILNQTFGDFEFLIFNDASTDDSLKIIRSYDDARIRVIDNPVNTGYVPHLNHGLKIANGEYIARMDADDIALPQRFEKQIYFLDKHPEVGVCGTLYEIFGGDSKIMSRPETHNQIFTFLLLIGAPMGHPTVMMRNKILRDGGFFYREEFMPAEDYFMWYELINRTGFYNLQEVLLRYRVHEANISKTKEDTQTKQSDLIKRRAIAQVGKLSTTRDAAKIDLLFNFLNVAGEAKAYKKADVAIINDFLDEAFENKMIDKNYFLGIIGKKRYLICQSAKRSYWLYLFLNLMRRIRISGYAARS